jgi:hypothetical protein
MYIANFEDMKVKVLCFADIEDMYEIMYTPRESFIVHLPDHNLNLKQRGKMYIANFAE